MSDIAHKSVTVGDTVIHVAEVGEAHAPTFVLLHGWPESWRTWQELMQLAASSSHVIAIDLPGIGRSRGRTSSGAKSEIAAVVHSLILAMGLQDVTLVGHDIGGMVAYAYLREFDDLRSAVIMNVPIPGVDPWEDFIRQPFLWHFALHAVPALPEVLVAGREAVYLGYFYDLLSAHPDSPSPASRAEQIAAYESVDALAAGFDWYRAFASDTEHNHATSAGPDTQTPLLYLRGEKERGGALEPYVKGLRRAGVSNVRGALVPGSGHFPQEEATQETWRILSGFAADPSDF
ncbi:MAG: alpha/beta hydrolase [Pseudonocardiales bacterium]|nr:alpha/beta hydrolase [Pseudonocardiales bacterium]